MGYCDLELLACMERVPAFSVQLLGACVHVSIGTVGVQMCMYVLAPQAHPHFLKPLRFSPEDANSPFGTALEKRMRQVPSPPLATHIPSAPDQAG